jgi:hypothetical protein
MSAATVVVERVEKGDYLADCGGEPRQAWKTVIHD